MAPSGNNSAATASVDKVATNTAGVSVDDPVFADIRLLNHPRLRPDRQPRLAVGVKGEYVPAKRSPVVLADGALPLARMCAQDSVVAPTAIFGRREKLAQFAADYPGEWDAIVAAGVPVYDVSAALLREVVGFDLHRGLLGVAPRPAIPDLQQLSGHATSGLETSSGSGLLHGARTVVILEGVGDPDNIGAIFRSAASLSADAILFGAGCSDLWDRRVIRVSLGQALRVPSIRIAGGPNDWHHGLAGLQDSGFHVVALSPGNGSVELHQSLVRDDGTGREKVAFLLGAEGPGLSSHAMAAADSRAVIPMAAGADSLNVATTAACCLYERWRARD